MEWVKYPNDTDASRTEYTYDNMYRLASAQADVGSQTLSAAYTYADDLLTKIQTGSTTYSFSYGNFALRSAITIGDRMLASYEYTNDGRNSLNKLVYGNGDMVQYTYDEQGRVTAQAYEDGDTVTYAYDNNGALATVTDSATSQTATYYYDFTDRLVRYTDNGENYTLSLAYTYDTDNQVTKIAENINGYSRTTSVSYDDDNRIVLMQKGYGMEGYTYDAFGRLSSRRTYYDGNTRITESFSYRVPSSGTTTGQVAAHTIASPRYNATLSYTYDGNGNILTISDGNCTTSYTYDTANQLTRENNQKAGKTWVWTYDNAGNILSRREYAYTTGTLGAVLDTVSYGYTDSAWGDLLTSYDGQTITADEIGNMLSDGTWTYTWEHGRELVSMTDGATTWSYEYNADGLRTKRTNGTNTYYYYYADGQLLTMRRNYSFLRFAYDASGAPMTVIYGGETYFYVTNIQGDVIAILDDTGATVVEYTYDAWGNVLTTTGSMASTLGETNPLRYRGYVYDEEVSNQYLLILM